MVKKIIGIIVALAVIVVIVVTALHRHGFQSMVLDDEIMDQNLPAPVVPVERSDALPSGTIEAIDSVAVEVTDSIR